MALITTILVIAAVGLLSDATDEFVTNDLPDEDMFDYWDAKILIMNNFSQTIGERKEKLLEWGEKYGIMDLAVVEILGEAKDYPKITSVFERLPEAFEKYKAIETDDKTVAQVEEERAEFGREDPQVAYLINYALHILPHILATEDNQENYK